MENLLKSLLTPFVLCLCATAEIMVFNLNAKQTEIVLILCGVFSIYLFADVYTSLTTKTN